MTADQPCAGCGCEAEHDGDYGASGHHGPCPPHTCSRHPVSADHTPERLRWHMHVSSGLICTMTHLAPDAEPTVPVHILTDDDLAAHLADVEARLAEQSETIVSLREGYRDAVGVPPSEHQSRRLEAMAIRIEELMAENAAIRAALHPAPSEQPAQGES